MLIRVGVHRRWRLPFLLSVLLPAAAGLRAPAASAQRVPAEYQLKAAFVSKFPQFTEWPESALDGRDTIDLCVTRPNPFGSVLADLISGTTLNGRRLVEREIDGPGALGSCQVVFVARQSPSARRALLARAASLPVLTVGDYPEFLDEGGVVNLRMADGRVRFDVNVDTSSRVGVRLASQLLRLAATVKGSQR